MFLKNVFRNGAPCLCQFQVTAFVHCHIATGLQQANGTANAGFGKAHILTDIYGTNIFTCF